MKLNTTCDFSHRLASQLEYHLNPGRYFISWDCRVSGHPTLALGLDTAFSPLVLCILELVSHNATRDKRNRCP